MPKTFLSKKIAPDTTRILYRNSLKMMFFGFVTCYIRNVKFNYAEAFREFRDAFNVKYEQYEDRRCYYLMSELSKEHREFCRTELKKLEEEK